MKPIVMIVALAMLIIPLQVYAQSNGTPGTPQPLRYVIGQAQAAPVPQAQAPQQTGPEFPRMRPAAPQRSVEQALNKPARHGGEEKGKKGNGENGKNGKAPENGEEKENGDNGEGEAKTLCKQKYQFNLPFGRDPKCGGVKGEVEKEVKVQCPPPPEKPGLCPGDYPNGNGNGNGNGKNGKEEEKKDEAKEEEGGGPDRVWDSVHGG